MHKKKQKAHTLHQWGYKKKNDTVFKNADFPKETTKGKIRQKSTQEIAFLFAFSNIRISFRKFSLQQKKKSKFKQENNSPENKNEVLNFLVKKPQKNRLLQHSEKLKNSETVFLSETEQFC